MKDIEKPADCASLPKRFRAYILSLESSVASLEASRPVTAPTRVKVVDRLALHDDRDEQYLPDDTEVAFRVRDSGGGQWIAVKLARRQEPGDDVAIELCAEWDGLALYPSSSNVVYVRIVRR